MKVLFAAALALTTGCVATTGGYVATQPVQPVVTADVNVGVQTDPPPPVDTEPPDENTYDDDLYEGEPDLVELNSNVRVVYGADDAVFFSDGFYWRYGDDGSWYRSNVYNGGWSVYADVPVHIRTIDRPVQYRRYRPATYTPRARKVGPRPAKTRPSYARPVRNNNRPANYNRNDNRPGNYDKRPAQPTRNDNRPGNYDKRPAQPARTDNRPGNYDRPAQPARTDNRPGNYDRPAQPTRTDNRPGNYDKPAQPARTDNRPGNYDKGQPSRPDTRPTKDNYKKDPPPAPKKDPPPKKEPKKDDDYKKKKR